jgi:hypothetical protein
LYLCNENDTRIAHELEKELLLEISNTKKYNYQKIYFMKHRSTLLLALLCASIMGFAAIDWNAVDFLGSTDPSISMNTYKYAVDTEAGEQGPNTIANIQPADGRLGFYSTYGQGISSCSHEGKISGDQLWLYVDQLTAKDTKITVTLADASVRTFHMWYISGTEGESGGEGGGEGTDPTPKPEPTLGTFTINSVWPEDRVTASMDGEDIKVNIASFGNGQWNAQLKINHNISFVNTKSYKIAFTLTSDKDCGGITLKTDDNHGEVYENQSINLTANTPFYYEKVFSGTPDNNKITVFDFGWV